MKKELCNKPDKLREGHMEGLTNLVNKSNHIGQSDHKFLNGQAFHGRWSHPKPIAFLAKVSLYFK